MSVQQSLGNNNTANQVDQKRLSRAGHNIGCVGMIWAQDRHRVLGAAGGMLWRVPADFKHFRTMTLHCPVIMGRSSYEALGGALPDRQNIVLTRDESWNAPDAIRAASFEEAFDMVSGSPYVWIIGGGNVYAQGMDYADELVISELDYEADIPCGHNPVYAPLVSDKLWRIDNSRTDRAWRDVSGDAAWRVVTYVYQGE